MDNQSPLLAPPLPHVELLLNLNRLPEAEHAARQVLAQNPAHARAMGLLGVALVRQQRVPEAIQTLHRAIGLAPTDASPYAWLAEAHLEAKDLLAAQAAIDEALKLQPLTADFHGLLALIRFRQLRLKQALRAARVGLALDSTHKQCLGIQARALAALGQADTGILLFEPALAAPTDATGRANQGFNHLDSGNIEEAKAHLLEALRQQPNNELVRQGLLTAYKSSFWIYRAVHQLLRLGLRLVHATGFFQIEADIRKIIFYVLQIPWVFFAWGLAYQHGLLSNVSFPVVCLRLFLLTPLGAILVFVVVAAFFKLFTLTLLRLNSGARPYLSPREILVTNCFLAVVGIALSWAVVRGLNTIS